MPNGFFMGGMAEGIQASQKQDLAERTLAQDTGLRSRGLDITQANNLSDAGLRTRALDIQEKAQKRAEAQVGIARVDKQIADTMAIVAETIKVARESGTAPEAITKAITPLVDSAKQLSQRVGRNPAALDATVSALLVSPSAIDKAKVEGQSEAAKTVAKTTALTAAGQNVYGIENPKDRATAENSLRDDYLKQSGNFIKLAEQKQRLDSIEKTGAGDVALVFTYMKMLDPTSTVREGEYATASNASGVPGSLIGQYNKLVGGGLLGQKARDEIRSQAERFFQKEANQHDKRTTQFANIAKRQGLNPDNVVVDVRPQREETFDSRFPKVPPPPKGFQIIQ